MYQNNLIFVENTRTNGHNFNKYAKYSIREKHLKIRK